MKQMSLIEMDGFLKGKCIPCDLKVNETNAEYLVRKFGELESKLETALRECRSAGITIKDGEWPIDNGIIEVYAAPPVPVVPAALPENDDEDGHDIDYLEPSEVYALGRTTGWNACREAMFQSGNLRENTNSSTNNFREIPETSTNSPVTSVLLPGGFTIEDAKELHEDLVRSHISQALSGEKMKKKDRDADLRWIHGVIVQAAWFVKASLEQNALSGNSPVIPGEVLSAIREVARIRADFDDFDGDRRGIGDCLDEAEQELIVTINKYASQLAAEPIAPNDVREQTAIPQVPVTPDGWISCSERMPDKLIPVMVMYEDGEMWSAMWNGNRWDDGTEYPDPHSVTHWREMPAEPPQEVN